MRDLISKGLLTAAAATSVLSLSGGYALAVNTEGAAADSPGVVSGNSVQAPVEIPVNVCGNTVDPVGALNPTFGNGCGTSSGSSHADASHHRDTAGSMADHGASTDTAPLPSPAHKPMPRPDLGDQPMADYAHHHVTGAGTGATAAGVAHGSPGVLSGNLLQAPVDVPVNACGNTVDVVGVLNPAYGNDCQSGPTYESPGPRHHCAPPGHETPAPPHHWSPPGHETPAPPHHWSPPAHHTVPPVPVTHHVPPAPAVPTTPTEHSRHDTPVAQLAHTGADANLLAAAAMSAGLLLGGGILYRRGAAARA